MLTFLILKKQTITQGGRGAEGVIDLTQHREETNRRATWRLRYLVSFCLCVCGVCVSNYEINSWGIY